MGQQDGQVERPQQSRALEAHGAYLRVIEEITDEKQDGTGESRQHTGPVSSDPALPDHQEAGNQKGRAQTIQRGVEGRQRREIRHEPIILRPGDSHAEGLGEGDDDRDAIQLVAGASFSTC